MRADLTGLVVAASATWLVCAYAYMLGLFLPYGLGNLGLLGLDDVLAASASGLTLTAALLLPLIIAVFWFIPVDKREQTRLASRPSQAMVLIVVAVLLLIQMGMAAGTLPAQPLALKLVLPAAACFIAVLGLSHDIQSGGATGRIAAALLVAAVMSYRMGEYAQPEQHGDRPVRVQLTDGGVLCGDLVLASPAGLFIAASPDGVLGFTPAEAYRRLSARKCQPHEAPLTSSASESR